MTPPTATPASTLVFTATCDAGSIRSACEGVRRFLAQHGVGEDELGQWELILMEAGVNAVRYCPAASQSLPVRLEVLVTETVVEVRVTDHTPGFDLPETVELPPPDSEHGRGLFLIKSLTTEAEYLRGRKENCFVLRKRREQPAVAAPELTVEDLKQKLSEADSTLESMTEELASSFESLSAVFRFSSELTGQGNPEALARKWLDELLNTVQADWFVFRLAEPDGSALRLVAQSGRVAAEPTYSLKPENVALAPVAVRAALERKDVWFDALNPRRPGGLQGKGFNGGCGFSHPIVINDYLVGVITFARHQPDAVFKAAQVNVIETFADFLGFQIRNAQLQEERLQTRLVTRELEIAAGIQQSLLPSRLPDLQGLHLASHYRSARHVGGDFFDVVTTPGGGLLLVMADVMGKGIPAAMFATIFRTLIHARVDLAPSPGAFLSWVNNSFAEELGRVDMFVTSQLAYFHPGSRQLRFAGAGHPPLLLATPSGEVRKLESGGPPLGILPGMDYTEEWLTFPASARILLYTDGLNEARNAAGELLGLEALEAAFAATARERLPVAATRDRLISLLTQFESGTPQADDQAFVLLAEDAG